MVWLVQREPCFKLNEGKRPNLPLPPFQNRVAARTVLHLAGFFYPTWPDRRLKKPG